MAVLPALVPEEGEAALLGNYTLLLLERGTEGARGDLGVLVVPAKWNGRGGSRQSPDPTTHTSRIRKAVSCMIRANSEEDVREDVAPGSTAHDGG